MPAPDQITRDTAQLAEEIGRLAGAAGVTIAVAESLTGGKLACQLAAAPSSSDWFRGGVVAYSSQVKYDVLGVPPGPVISEQCAQAMADGVARLLGADLAVAVTGVGGPDRQEDQPPGTVCFGLVTGAAETHHFEGEPQDVLDRTTVHALELLRQAVARAASG